MLKAVGTIEEYEAKADAVKASLRRELQCFLPACVLTVTVKAGSVILTVIATDTAEGRSQVELAAVALQTKPLPNLSIVLGITVEEAPAAASVVAVQVQVTRLAPSPPPRLPPRPRPPTSESGGGEDSSLALLLAGAGAGLLVALILVVAVILFRRAKRCAAAPRASPSRLTYITLSPASSPHSPAPVPRIDLTEPARARRSGRSARGMPNTFVAIDRVDERS